MWTGDKTLQSLHKTKVFIHDRYKLDNKHITLMFQGSPRLITIIAMTRVPYWNFRFILTLKLWKNCKIVLISGCFYQASAERWVIVYLCELFTFNFKDWWLFWKTLGLVMSIMVFYSFRHYDAIKSLKFSDIHTCCMGFCRNSAFLNTLSYSNFVF